MKFIEYHTYLNEYENSKKISQKDKIETKYGWLDYYYEISNEYPNGVVVDLGGYVYKEYRGQGKLKEMLKQLFSLFPTGTTIQMAVKNKHLIPMFKRWGFKPVKQIMYWGEVKNAMESTITSELINNV